MRLFRKVLAAGLQELPLASLRARAALLCFRVHGAEQVHELSLREKSTVKVALAASSAIQ